MDLPTSPLTSDKAAKEAGEDQATMRTPSWEEVLKVSEMLKEGAKLYTVVGS